jgi:23S rRNA (adenine-N6)-dimethyltransferase
VSVRRSASAGAPRGQHFLRSKRLAAEIAARANLSEGDLVVDVGAGTGVLTRALADTGARVVALERDDRLARELQRRLGDVTVVAVDATRWSWPDEPFAVVANLPFAIAADLLRVLLDDPRVPLTRAELIVQWELARKRTSVWPSTLRGVYWSAWHELALGRHLSPNAFAPPPSVDAGVLSVRRRAAPLVPVEAASSYFRFVEQGFRRHGPLRRVLAPLEWKRLAVALGFPADATGRDLDAHQWAALYEASAPSGNALQVPDAR